MRINHNIASLNTYRQLSSNSVNSSKSLEKLSAGLRINKAGDDAAGLAISEKMRGQIRGLDQASRNAQDGISMIQTAEGALSETHSILQRMRELSIQSSNDTNTDDDRASIQQEISQLKGEIDRIGNTTEFNTQKLLNGDKGASTTSADLTGGVAKTIDANNALNIKNATEVENNIVNVIVGAGTANVTVAVNMSEGSYDNLVSFTKEFNQSFNDALDALKAAGGEDFTAMKNKVKLNFDIDTATGDATFQLQEDGTTALTSVVTVDFGTIQSALATSLGISADITMTLSTAAKTAAFNTNAGSWDAFAVTLEDGIEQTANQNNKLSMTYDGMSVTSYVAEANYTTEATAAEALRDAIVGADITGTARFNTIITNGDANTIDGSNWTDLKSAAKTYGLAQSGTSAATGLIGAVDALSADQLRAKGYSGTTDAMKESYLYDLYKNSDATLSASFNADNKLEVSAPANMTVDETSKAAVAFGMTAVNSHLTDSGVTLQIGSNAAQTMVVGINDMRTTAIGAVTINSVNYKLDDVDVSTKTGSQNAVKILDQAIKDVSTERSKLGAVQNRLEHTINNLGTTSENLTASESRIRDVDMAKEMMEFTKNNILSQAAQAMLAQANQQPQGVLQLLR